MHHTHPTDASVRPAHIHQQRENLFSRSSRPFTDARAYWLRRLARAVPLLALGLFAFLATGTARADDVKITAVAAGYMHNLFLTDDGRLWGLGENIWGELGNGSTASSKIPTQAQAKGKVITMDINYNHSLFVTEDGNLWSMGCNDSGQLGDGTTTQRLYPVQVKNASNVIAVAVGNGDLSLATTKTYAHSLFVTKDGKLWAMGSNDSGQLGDGTTTDRSTPVQVKNATNVIAATAGNDYSLFVTSDGKLWGMGITFGISANVPVQVPVPTTAKVIAVSAKERHSLFATEDGKLWAMGHNAYGQLGDGTTTNKSTPVQVPVPTTAKVIAVSAGSDLSSFVTEDGKLWAMGDNSWGELGDGTTTERHTPVLVDTSLIAAAPTVTSISPMAAKVGDTITIIGTNLTGTTVTIGGAKATSVSVSADGTTLKATVPAGATNGATLVTTTAGYFIGSQFFNLITTTGLAPATLPVGATFTFTLTAADYLSPDELPFTNIVTIVTSGSTGGTLTSLEDDGSGYTVPVTLAYTYTANGDTATLTIPA